MISIVFKELQKKIIGLVKHELEMYKIILRKDNINYYESTKVKKWNLREEIFLLTLSYLKDMEHKDLANALQSELSTDFYKQQHKLVIS